MMQINSGDCFKGYIEGTRKGKYWVCIFKSSRIPNEFVMHGTCFECGEFLEWAEKKLFCFTVVLMERLIFKGGMEVEKVSLCPPQAVHFSSVIWGKIGHTTEIDSACSGYGRFICGSVSVQDVEEECDIPLEVAAH